MLALQMLCTPLAYALSVDGAEEAAEAEVELAGDYAYQGATAGFGVPVKDPDPSVQTGRRFDLEQELTPAGMKRFASARIRNSCWTTEADGRYLDLGKLCPDIGRLPDKMLTGWYYYEDADTDPATWCYTEDLTDMAASEADEMIGPDPAPASGAMLSNGYLPLVARWEDSDISEGRSAAIYLPGETEIEATLYHADISDLTKEELEGQTGGTGFDPGICDYYLRVPSDVESVRLTFDAFEPYGAFADVVGYRHGYDVDSKQVLPTDPVQLEEHGADSPVTLTAAFGEGEEDLSGQLFYAIENDAGYLNSWWYPTNSGGDIDGTEPKPAYSTWRADAIPLDPAAGAEGQYNTITLAVTAPDGVSSTEYRFHIQRLTDPVMELAPGNTPFGMIERDTSGVWGSSPEEIQAAKEAAKDYFRLHHRFDLDQDHPRPMDESNNNGHIYPGVYPTQAWLDENYDEDPTAIVAYENTGFVDPGFTLTDSRGDPVAFGDGEDLAGSVTRELVLRLADTLTTGEVGENKGRPEPFLDKEIVLEPNGGSFIDLRDQHVVPGIYHMDYRFTDPLTGQTYGFDETDGFWQENAEAFKTGFRRTLIVLPAPGDVDMDGEVTFADGAALDAALGDSFSFLANAGSDGSAALFTHRVCNVADPDAPVVDRADALALKDGYAPQMIDSGNKNWSDYYYLPLPDGGTAPDRATLPPTEEGGDRAALRLTYLGKGTRPATQAQPPLEAGLQLGDVFWVGVQMDPSQQDLLRGDLQALRLSLAYDSRYVEPVGFRDTTPVADEAAWRETLRTYNILQGSANTLWSGTGYSYTLGLAMDGDRPVGMGTDQPATAYPSRPITPLEHAAGLDQLREIAVSFRLDAGGSATSLSWGGCLLAAPFRVKQHPKLGAASWDFVELGLGMRELTATDARRTLVYSMDQSIFGGASHSLSQAVFFPQGPGLTLGLGKDTTPTTHLTNQAPGVAVGSDAGYGDWFYYHKDQFMHQTITDGALPPGLELRSNGDISGYPTEAGYYVFYIANAPFSIQVDRAPMRLYTVPADKYYGEELYCGVGSGDVAWRYYPEDVKVTVFPEGDRPGLVNTGLSSDLTALLGPAGDGAFVPPTFTAADGAGGAIDRAAPVGTYRFTQAQAPYSTNYDFTYLTQAPDGTAAGTLKVRPRPVVVNALAPLEDPDLSVGTIFDDDSPTLAGCSAVNTAAQGAYHFVPGLPVRLPAYDSAAGTYDGRGLTGPAVLPGDELKVTYTAVYQKEAKDAAPPEGKTFVLDEGVDTEPRTVDLSALRMDPAYGAAANYELVSNAFQDTAAAVGTVHRKVFTSIEIVRVPWQDPDEDGQQVYRTYTYGQNLSMSGASLLIIPKSGDKGDLITYKESVYADLGLEVSWATEAQKAAGEKGELTASHGQGLTPGDHDGRYLCISTVTTGADGKPAVTAYSDVPVTVEKKELTLTAANRGRYYGEPDQGELTYTYDRTMLITRDRPDGVDLTQPGTAEELEHQLKTVKGYHFTAPSLTAVESLSVEGWREDPSKLVPITQDTPVTNVANRILIAGAETDNYRFTYVRDDGGPNKTTGPDYGYGTLFIYPRPIVVKAVQAPEDPLLTVYADTEDLDVKEYRFSPEDLALEWPKESNGHLNYYLPGVQGGDPEQRQPEMTLTGSPIYKGEIGFKATVSFRGFQDRPYRNSFTEGYFDLGTAAEKEYPVALRDLALDPSLPDTRNYVLVFHTYGDAYEGFPADRDSQDYRAGVGTVKLRAVEGIDLTRFDNTRYTYGDQLSLQDVTAVIHYEGGLDEPLTYTRVSKDMDNFQERGLGFYFWTGESGLDAEEIHAKAAAAGFYVTVGEEDGAYLAVGGRRHPSHPLVVSNQSPAPISVAQKDLPVQLQDIHRFYGEENGAYQFTFRIADLAQPDQGKVASGGETAPGPALAGVDPDGYRAPGIRTEAEPGSPVKALGKEGYELTLDGSGSMTNYRLVPKAGQIYVYRRPIRVDHVISAYHDDITKDRSIYTIYADTEARLFTTSVGRDRYAANLPGSTAATPETSNRVLALTGPALRAGDVVDMSLKVQFSKEITDLETAHMEQDVLVSGFAVLPGGQGGNYYLLSDQPNHPEAKGRIELREIEKIEIVQPPKRALDSYTYGDELELQGLEVKITYAKKDMESSNPTRNVAYAGQAGFNAEGLFLNYWSGPAPTDPNAYGDGLLNRAANSGDHLTIAPDHSLAPEPGDDHWDPSFAHQGKQLIVTAQRNKEHGFAVPQVLAGTIAIQPRRVGYALEAQNKVYDGTTAGAGTVTLENIVQGDVVWTVTGNAYEPNGFTDSNTPEGFAAYYADFYAHIREKGAYSFESYDKGLSFTYIYPNVRYADERHSAEAPAALSDPYWLTEQAPRAPGEAGWDVFGPVAPMPVEVTGITLAGPDAANYTFASDGTEVRETQALRTTRDQADDGQDPAPYATIWKAPRPALPDLTRPGLELDEHTNVLRLLYGQSVADLFGDAAYDPAELHFEYALDRYDPATGTTERHGQGEGWQDTTYFGGEAVTAPAAPDGFVPDSTGSSGGKEEEIVKGQVYRWAELDPGMGTRTALDRDADYRAVVRLAETHNYLPSGPLASVDDDALAAAAAESKARSKAWADLFEKLEKGGKLPEDFVELVLAGPVVKTYAQRLDLLSAAPGKDGAGEKAEALTLEAVWFTDVRAYAHDKVMDAVVRNAEPQRYYAYYWDAGKKTRVKFDPDGLDLTGPLTVEVDAEGGKVEVTVNEDATAQLYVATAPISSSGVFGSITIRPDGLEARVGDEPVALTAVVRGDWGGTLRWSSSDTGVAAVSPEGVVTFVGPGTAKITAKLGPLTDSIQVKVGEALPKAQVEEEETVGSFRANFTGPFLFLNAALRFRPQQGITRGELVELLDRFFAPKGEAGETVTFEDVERDAAFAEALDRMSAYGIVTGVPGGAFRPGDFATRAELAAMLARMMDLPIPDTKKKPHAFVDAGEGDTWAWAYIDALSLAGVANGTGQGRFHPERVLTRAEFAAFLDRALIGGLDPEAEGLTIPTDVPGDHWGYEAILRAVNGLPEDPSTEDGQR